MPLIISGNAIDLGKIHEQAVKEVANYDEVRALAEKAAERKAAKSDSNRKVVAPAQPRARVSPDDPLVVVDGKAKKIGKQSKYLLDMLTIDE